jgi:DNA invertase Pin-like site-specific DNA recombinase
MDTLNVIELVRVSTDAQAGEDRGGIPAQRTACADIARRNKLTVKWQIEMQGVSGAAVMYSPEMHKLMQILRGGECHGVVMKECTRLMRPDNFEDMALLQLFKESRVKIYTHDQVLDISTASGQLMAQVQFGMAAYERTTIMRRCTDARRELRSSGKLSSGTHTLPFALTYDRKREAFAWDAVKSVQVERLFELFVSGTTAYAALARETGISFHSIPDILKNHSYTGVRIFDERRDPSTKKIDPLTGKYRDSRKVKVDPSEVVRVVLPCGGIVSDDLFARAQKLLALKRDMRWKRNNESEDRFVYRGFLKCGKCGSRMLSVAHKGGDGKTRDYYVCRGTHGDRGGWDKDTQEYAWRIQNNSCDSRRIRRDALEVMLDDVMSTRLSDPEMLYKLIESHRRACQTTDNKRTAQRLAKEIAATDDKLKRLKVLFVNGDLEQSEYESAKAAISSQVDGARKQLAALTPDTPNVSVETLVSVAAPFQQWQWLDVADRRRLLTAVVPVINVSATGEKRRGVDTKIKVDGFYLMLTGDANEPEDGNAGTHQPRQKGRAMRATRVNTTAPALVSDKVHSPKDLVTDQPVYIPLSA